jgi:hypothetical protein
MEGSDKFGRKYGRIIQPLVILEVSSKEGISLSNVQGFLRTLYSQVHCDQMVMWLPHLCRVILTLLRLALHP